MPIGSIGANSSTGIIAGRMSLQDDIRTLQRVALFADFADEQLRLLAFGAEDRDLAAGTTLFEAGERADAGYVIVSGAVEFQDAEGAALGRAGPGALIGELALMVETERPSRAVVTEASRVILIRRSLFRRMLQEFPDLARRVQTAFLARLKTTTSGLERVRAALTALDDADSA